MPQLAEKIRGLSCQHLGTRMSSAMSSPHMVPFQASTRVQWAQGHVEKTQMTDAYPEKVSPQHLTLSRAETTKHRKALWGEVEGQARVHLRTGANSLTIPPRSIGAYGLLGVLRGLGRRKRPGQP